MGLVFTVKFTVEGGTWQAQAKVTAGDVVPAVGSCVVIAAVEPVPPVGAIEAIVVAAEHGKAGKAESEVRCRREVGADAEEARVVIVRAAVDPGLIGAVAFEEAVEEMDVGLAEETEEAAYFLWFNEVGLNGRQGTHVVA